MNDVATEVPSLTKKNLDLISLPEHRAESIINVFARLAKIYNIPMEYAMQLAGAEATKISGLPFDRLLARSQYVSEAEDNDMMLEPVVLGIRLSMTERQVNSLLCDHGLQVRTSNGYEPTEDGEYFCRRHQFTRNGKLVYMLQWRTSFVYSLAEESGWPISSACGEQDD